MTLSDIQQHYFDDRYALKDASGNQVEKDIKETWYRVSSAMSDDEEQQARFYSILDGFRFVPGGRILSGAGAETEKTFYNCYVIPVEAKHPTDFYPNDYPGNDSREAIFDTIKTMVDIMSRGGGVGINWSVLRPSGSYLTRISGSSSGPVGWMDVASKAVGEVIQGGSRRGAAMFMIDDWHPDVLKFIDAKRDNSKVTNANISVSVSDRFMEAVENDEEWNLIFPDTTDKTYNRSWEGDIAQWTAEGKPVRTYQTIKARALWDSIGEAAHASGEPGVVFIERYNKQSTANGAERIISVNPCGEQGLGAYSVCNLGAMNLDAYVRTYPQTNEGQAVDFNWMSFRQDVAIAVEFLDNVIDKSFYFLPQTKSQQMRLRRIGLGVMGLADALVRLGIRYGSEESVQFVEDVFRTMKDAAIEKSAGLGYEKGSAKGWTDDMWQRPYLKEYLDRRGSDNLYFDYDTGSKDPKVGLRNLFLLTQAPTGTTSLLAGVNSGIEPYFNIKTWREDRTGGRWVYAKAVQDAIDDGSGIVAGSDFVVTAKDIPVEEHIAIQAAVQKWVDSSVSKTINAPNEQTVEETKKAFTLAYKSGLKGIAYYRDGSRDIQVLYHEKPNDRIKELEEKIKELEAKLDSPFWKEQREAGFFSQKEPLDNKCPACDNGSIVHEEGCLKCYSCGWSAC